MDVESGNIQRCNNVNNNEQQEKQKKLLKKIGEFACGLSLSISLSILIITVMANTNKSSSSSRGEIILHKTSAGFALLGFIAGFALYFFLNIFSVGTRTQLCLIFVAVISALAGVVIFVVNIILF